jgi:uncharacterized protein with NAD-binding domain and iron-sulfur cluster
MSMTDNDKQNDAESLERTVAVIGGGLSGITAAVKLFKQGYHVTLFEKNAALGGNLSSNSKDNTGQNLDVYPHIFGDWYREFWYLLEQDFGLLREDIFEVRDKIKMATIPGDAKRTLKTFSDVEYADLGTPTSLMNLVENMDGRILSRRDMFLFAYTYLDLVSVPRRSPLKVLDRLDVTGYLYSRPFMNESIAGLHDAILKVIWSMPSNETSAHAYQDLLRHTMTFPHETPFAWLVKGPAGKKLIEPITKKLTQAFAKTKGQSAVLPGTEVTELDIDDESGLLTLGFRKTPDGAKEVAVAPQSAVSRKSFRYVIVATQCSAALQLAFSSRTGKSMMKRAHTLAGLREANTGRIPVVYLYFNKAFAKKQGPAFAAMPRELIGFKCLPSYRETPDDGTNPDDDDYDISVLDISKLWDKADLKSAAAGEPVLVVAASHAGAIYAPGPEEADDGGEAQGYEIIRKLCEYLPFINPGERWGKGGDIDWDRTRVITNKEHQLFLNGAGAEAWRPYTHVPGLENIFFAGDYCRTDVNMATIEAAVQSGVLAAQAVQAADGTGHPILLQPHDLYANNALLLAKLLATPLAVVAALSEMLEVSLQSPIDTLMFPFAAVARTAAYSADWLRSAMQFWQGFLPAEEYSPSGAPSRQSVAEHDNAIGLLQAALNIAGSLLHEGPTALPIILRSLGGLLHSTLPSSTGNAPYPYPQRAEKPWPIPTAKPLAALANSEVWDANLRINLLAANQFKAKAARGQRPAPNASHREAQQMAHLARKARRMKSRGYRAYNVIRDI